MLLTTVRCHDVRLGLPTIHPSEYAPFNNDPELFFLADDVDLYDIAHIPIEAQYSVGEHTAVNWSMLFDYTPFHFLHFPDGHFVHITQFVLFGGGPNNQLVIDVDTNETVGTSQETVPFGNEEIIPSSDQEENVADTAPDLNETMVFPDNSSNYSNSPDPAFFSPIIVSDDESESVVEISDEEFFLHFSSDSELNNSFIVISDDDNAVEANTSGVFIQVNVELISSDDESVPDTPPFVAEQVSDSDEFPEFVAAQDSDSDEIHEPLFKKAKKE